MKNLAKAVIAVMQEVKGMEKNSKVGTGNSQYDGTKDQDVKEVFNEVMAKNGLCILPIEIEDTTKVERWEETVYYGQQAVVKTKQSVFTKVNTKYLLLHESGESQILAGFGQGIDSQDKGAGKATTYALKNTLLAAFLTPVGKIDDTDQKHSDDIAVVPIGKAPAQAAPISAPVAEPVKTEAEIATEKKRGEVIARGVALINSSTTAEEWEANLKKVTKIKAAIEIKQAAKDMMIKLKIPSKNAA
jgi:hypothetical protein